jgi:hypothetical protein
LSFSHFRVVAKLDHEAQKTWLDRAAAEQWTVTDLDYKLWEAGQEAKTKAWATGDAPDPAAPKGGFPPPRKQPQAATGGRGGGDDSDEDEELIKKFNAAIRELGRCEPKGARMFAATNARPSRLRVLAAFLEVVANELEGRTTIKHEPSDQAA